MNEQKIIELLEDCVLQYSASYYPAKANKCLLRVTELRKEIYKFDDNDRCASCAQKIDGKCTLGRGCNGMIDWRQKK